MLKGQRLVRRFDELPRRLAGAGLCVLGVVFLRYLEQAWVGGGFLAAGAVLMLLHRTAVVDGQVRTLTRTWGLLAPFRRSVWRLDEMDQVRVEMSTEVRHGRGGPHVYEVFWVTAFGPDGPLVLDRFRDDRAEAIRLGVEGSAGFWGSVPAIAPSTPP